MTVCWWHLCGLGPMALHPAWAGHQLPGDQSAVQIWALSALGLVALWKEPKQLPPAQCGVGAQQLWKP